jgi:hypothetical protein
MAEILEPIVLNLTDRGACAVDYIDLFDEGMYGPDKPFFIGRFKNLDDVAAQMNKCLELQSIEGSLIHYRRLHQDHVFREFPADINDPYPNKARNAIRFMLRIKFYGDFGYLDIGKKWEPLYNGGKLNENYPLGTYRLEPIKKVEDLTSKFVESSDIPAKPARTISFSAYRAFEVQLQKASTKIHLYNKKGEYIEDIPTDKYDKNTLIENRYIALTDDINLRYDASTHFPEYGNNTTACYLEFTNKRKEYTGMAGNGIVAKFSNTYDDVIFEGGADPMTSYELTFMNDSTGGTLDIKYDGNDSWEHFELPSLQGDKLEQSWFSHGFELNRGPFDVTLIVNQTNSEPALPTINRTIETDYTSVSDGPIESESEINISASDLSVINRCWLSAADANDILSYIKSSPNLNYSAPDLTKEVNEMPLSYLMDDSGIILTDDNGVGLVI